MLNVMLPSLAPQAVGLVPAKLATVNVPPFVPLTATLDPLCPGVLSATEVGLANGVLPSMRTNTVVSIRPVESVARTSEDVQPVVLSLLTS